MQEIWIIDEDKNINMKILKLKQIEENTLFYKKNILIKKLMLIPKKQILIYKLFVEKRKNQFI